MEEQGFRRRADITRDLVHFTKGATANDAFAILKRILADRQLKGGTGFIKGNYTCVCFTEAPIDQLREVFLREAAENLRYQPFGVMVTKRWLYDQGGRPAIYQPDAEFALLPNGLRYRHVRYEPTGDPVIDFTWEREWRIHTGWIDLDPTVVRVVVPNEEYHRRLRRWHDERQDMNVELYAQVLDEQLAELYRRPFPWNVVALGP